jgi:hypothetical protein
MKNITVQKTCFILVVVLVFLVSNLPVYARAAASVALGAAEPFGGFGGSAGITNQGVFTVVNGNIGTTGGSPLITGFHDTEGNVYTETVLNTGTVNGVIHTATAPPGSAPGVIAAAVALAAQNAFDKLSPEALSGGIDVSTLGGGAGALGGRTLAPGVYRSVPGSFSIQGGDLTLDAAGDPNAVWVFQMESTLTVGGPGAAMPQSVLLVNGAQARNVFWQVGSAATINAAGGGTMVGTISASSGISFSTAGNVTPVTLNGRALALHASLTMVNTVINVPAMAATKIGIHRNGTQWYQDINGNGIWAPPADAIHNFGIAGDVPVTGDWNGSGATRIGIFRNRQWFLDMNGNGIWEPATDAIHNFGIAGDVPVTGDWNGSGTTRIGIYRNGQWYLDIDGNGRWNFDIGENGVWDPATDLIHNFGIAGDVPVTGDWNGSGTTKIGVYRNGQWYLDMNGNGIWDPATDVILNFGIAGDIPVTGDWDGSGITRIGVYRNGEWYLDMNGNGIWEPGIDAVHGFGIPGDIPVTGKW